MSLVAVPTFPISRQEAHAELQVWFWLDPLVENLPSVEDLVKGVCMSYCEVPHSDSASFLGIT